VYNLTVNGKSIIYKDFAGKDSFDLNEKLIKSTEDTIAKIRERIDQLEKRMEVATKKLQQKDPDHKTISDKIHSGLKKPL